MVFILYKLYVLLPYTYPTPKLSPHRRHCAFLFSLKKTHSVWFISILNYGDTENVLINHLLLVIPMLYPCHYTNLCPHKPHKHAQTHTHTHTHMIYMKKNRVLFWSPLIFIVWTNSYLEYIILCSTKKWSKLWHNFHFCDYPCNDRTSFYL